MEDGDEIGPVGHEQDDWRMFWVDFAFAFDAIDDGVDLEHFCNDKSLIKIIII